GSRRRKGNTVHANTGQSCKLSSFLRVPNRRDRCRDGSTGNWRHFSSEPRTVLFFCFKIKITRFKITILSESRRHIMPQICRARPEERSCDLANRFGESRFFRYRLPESALGDSGAEVPGGFGM